LRWVSSQATQASWSFVVEDRARGAELLVDGRAREYDCDRAGRTIRCELRGLFPGGHTVELRLPDASFKRSVVIGRDWPPWPALVRVRTPDDAKEAAEAGADGVIADWALGVEALQDIAEVAHAAGARMFVANANGNANESASAIELAGADGIVGASVPADLKGRFPEAMSLAVDPRASQMITTVSSGRSEDATLLDQVRSASGLVETEGLVDSALAYLGAHGAIVGRAAFPLLKPRKRHSALKDPRVEVVAGEPRRLQLLLHARGDELVLLVNLSTEPWNARVPSLADPIDLLGSHVAGGAVELKPGDAALLVRSPQPDKTRY
jgi:hypothetical protein